MGVPFGSGYPLQSFVLNHSRELTEKTLAQKDFHYYP
jgi:hypothetical protein